MQEYRTQGGEREQKLGQQLLGWPLVHQEQCKRELQKAPVVVVCVTSDIQFGTNVSHLQQSRSARSVSHHLLLLSILWQWHPSFLQCAPWYPRSHLPFPLPNCSSFLLLSILSITQRREQGWEGPVQTVTANKREAPNCLRQSLHYLAHEHQKFCTIYKNTLLHF